MNGKAIILIEVLTGGGFITATIMKFSVNDVNQYLYMVVLLITALIGIAKMIDWSIKKFKKKC